MLKAATKEGAEVYKCYESPGRTIFLTLESDVTIRVTK